MNSRELAPEKKAPKGKLTSKSCLVQNMVITWEDALAASRLEGKASLLKRQLRRRFTDLPTWIDERVEKANQHELESWADRVLDAERLEDVFSAA